jgi:hypothetical protein
MQMRDALRQMQGGTAVDVLATAFGATAAQVEDVLRVVGPELAWAIDTRSLNRAGLADLVDAVGRAARAKLAVSADALQGEAARADGDRVLDLLFSSHAKAMLIADAARSAGLPDRTVAAMLPAVAAMTLDALAGRAESTLGALLAQMPSLGPWSKGSPHADMADILRRRCGAGPYGKRKLRRVVRRCLARAGSFGGFGLAGWYTRFMLRPAGKLMRPVLSRITSPT